MTIAFKKNPSSVLYGASRLTLNPEGKIIEQRDYYDLWGDIFDNIPRFGKAYGKFMKKKETSDGGDEQEDNRGRAYSRSSVWLVADRQLAIIPNNGIKARAIGIHMVDLLFLDSSPDGNLLSVTA